MSGSKLRRCCWCAYSFPLNVHNRADHEFVKDGVSFLVCRKECFEKYVALMERKSCRLKPNELQLITYPPARAENRMRYAKQVEAI